LDYFSNTFLKKYLELIDHGKLTFCREIVEREALCGSESLSSSILWLELLILKLEIIVVASRF
jgi:hypothetical protein